VKRLGSLVLAATLAAADYAAATPTIPADIEVFPVYSTPRQIRLRWTENGTATSYTVRRETNPDPTPTTIMTIGGGVAGHVVDVRDGAVVLSASYTYVVQACDATGCVFDVPRNTSVRTVWPISGGREILHGTTRCSAGPALVTSRPSPPRVASRRLPQRRRLQQDDGEPCRRGRCLRTARRSRLGVSTGNAGTVDNGFVQVEVDMGGGVFEYDGFNHLAPARRSSPRSPSAA